jgi:hypothetical protein
MMAAILPVMYGVRHYDLKKFFAGRAPTVFKREFLFKAACSTAPMRSFALLRSRPLRSRVSLSVRRGGRLDKEAALATRGRRAGAA